MKHPAASRSCRSRIPPHPYDAAAKQLLSQTPILAYILKNVAVEFKDCSLEEIMETCIDPDVRTESVPVHARAARSPLTLGLRSEDNSIDEGDVWYDVLFRACIPHGDGSVGVIVNIEAQSYEPDYTLMKRAFYYCARLLSAQRGSGPAGSDYNKLEKVYSIWLLANPPHRERNTIAVYSTHETPLHGTVRRDPETYDLQTVVLVALPKPGCYNEVTGFTETMATLLSPHTSASAKIHAFEQGIDPHISLGLKEELSTMTSLGEWAIEIGIERGLEQGIAQGIERGIEQGLEKGLEQGREQGRASGIEEQTLRGLRALMRTMHLDAPAAMDALELPHEQRDHYLGLLHAS